MRAEDFTGYDYERLIVDADTILIKSAILVQEDYVIVTHKPSGNIMEFNNQTEFWGHWKKKDGGWLAEKNAKREKKGFSIFSSEDFEIEKKTRPKSDMEDHVEEGVKIFDFLIGHLKEAAIAPEYLLLIGGDGNYRYDFAMTLPYKGNRPPKPLFFAEIREAIIKKYKRRVEVVNGREVDDQMAIYGLENYKALKRQGAYKYCLSYIDKDLKMITSPALNYDKLDEGIYINTPTEAARFYCTQLLAGDLPTDNIKGLPDLTVELREKYGVRKGKGLGVGTAESFLKSCETIPEMFSRVVEAYRAYYGDGTFEFETHRGETLKVTWKDMLQETAMLIYMNPLKDPLKYCIIKHMDKLGVKYD